MSSRALPIRRARSRYAVWTVGVLLLAATGCGQAAGTAPTTVLLVRHAEKDSGDDPALTAAGAARAEELARVAADAGLDAVYSTQFNRTQQTAEPAAAAAGVEVAIHAVDGADLETWYAQFAGLLLERHAGGRVLVVGHSNTVPGLIAALGAAGAPSLTEQDYDDLFVVTVDAARRARLLHLHYGSASP